jgi:hypothetical protein
MKVFILTYAPSMERLYGNTLIFKTLRVGFPNAEVHIYDNHSDMSCVSEIQKLAEENGCTFNYLKEPINHHDFIESQILSNEGTIIFLDPDIIFWKDFERFKVEKLVAGSFIPTFFDSYTQCLTFARVHSSFLWINDVGKLRNEVELIKQQKFEFNPYSPSMLRYNGRWLRYDTMAMLYHAIPDKFLAFREYWLEHYDHLFCGTHLESVIESIKEPYKSHWNKWHWLAEIGDLNPLKGIWMEQEKYFGNF